MDGHLHLHKEGILIDDEKIQSFQMITQLARRLCDSHGQTREETSPGQI
jgi:hypothetical protein